MSFLSNAEGPYGSFVREITIGEKTHKYYDLPALGGPKYGGCSCWVVLLSTTVLVRAFSLSQGAVTFLYTDELPFSIRVLLESAVRNCDGFQVKQPDVDNILDWKVNQGKSVEIPFRPARVILQDFT